MGVTWHPRSLINTFVNELTIIWIDTTGDLNGLTQHKVCINLSILGGEGGVL